MYLGRIVELADSDELFGNPLHPYTQALLAAVPVPDPRSRPHRTFRPVQGEVPSPIDPPPRLRVPSALPDRGGGLQARAAGTARGAAGAFRGMQRGAMNG